MTTTQYWDPRAVRAAAKGQAEQAKAEAEARRAETARAQQEAAAKQARVDREHRQQQREHKADKRRERLAAGFRWVAARPVELLLSLIVVVPAVLAWSAMAAYGVAVYGPVGTVLPLFSEGAMWAFAFAVHAARRDGKPTGWLQVGVWSFAAVNAALNFLHGFALSGVVTGLVMALVSVGGVLAHQLITAAPMRTRSSGAERAAARTARRAHRRAVRMERAAVATAVGELAADGSVRLRYAPATVTLTRSRAGRRRLSTAVVPGLVPAEGDTADEPGGELADEITSWLTTGSAGTGTDPVGTAQTPSEVAEETGSGTTELDPDLALEVERARRAIAAGRLPEAPSRRQVQRHLAIRSSTAQDVLRALRGERGDGGQEVAA